MCDYEFLINDIKYAITPMGQIRKEQDLINLNDLNMYERYTIMSYVALFLDKVTAERQKYLYKFMCAKRDNTQEYYINEYDKSLVYTLKLNILMINLQE